MFLGVRKFDTSIMRLVVCTLLLFAAGVAAQVNNTAFMTNGSRIEVPAMMWGNPEGTIESTWRARPAPSPGVPALRLFFALLSRARPSTVTAPRVAS